MSHLHLILFPLNIPVPHAQDCEHFSALILIYILSLESVDLLIELSRYKLPNTVYLNNMISAHT